MKSEKNVFRFFSPVFVFCALLVFGIALSGCNNSDDDSSTTVTVETTTWYMDADSDGYGDPEVSIEAETQPDGYVADNTDCDDSDAGIHPGATETCGDGIDQDCDGSDLTCETTVYYKDADADGYSDGTTLEAAIQPTGYYASGDLVSLSGDCDDTNADVHPGAAEACNDGIDNDCNGEIDCSDSACADDTDCSNDSDLQPDLTYPVVDTGQENCYDADGAVISPPAVGEAFYGQDAQFTGNQFSYTDNGDGTITDNVTGLMWQKTPANIGLNYQEAKDYCDSLNLAGYDDWRIPTTKELFSISDFSQGWPYLDTSYFDLAESSGVSKDEQYWTEYYVGTTVEGQENAAWGVNHGTGHIKAYPALVSGPMGNYVRAVRGTTSYGVNDFEDNGDGTVTDHATGLMWQQTDSGRGMDWEDALTYAGNLTLAGYDDWRLPNVKELQSIVDYTHAPSATDAAHRGPAIDTDFFNITALPSGTTDYDSDYGYFWTSTSAYFGKDKPEYYYAWYVSFGSAVGQDGADFHGAGAVRFDTKYEGGALGEGGERYYNYVRCVRDVSSTNGTVKEKNWYLDADSDGYGDLSIFLKAKPNRMGMYQTTLIATIPMPA